MFCGTDNILWNMPHIRTEDGKYSVKYCQIPLNTNKTLNNVMSAHFFPKLLLFRMMCIKCLISICKIFSINM